MVLHFTSLSDEIAVGGIVTLFLVWLIVSRTAYGFMLCGLGAIVIAVAMAYTAGNTHLQGILIAGVLIIGLLVATFVLMRTRRRRPRYHAPDIIDGRCSNCGLRHNVKRTSRGWLCGECRVAAIVAGHDL